MVGRVRDVVRMVGWEVIWCYMFRLNSELINVEYIFTLLCFKYFIIHDFL
jgi:hypothetical protein